MRLWVCHISANLHYSLFFTGYLWQQYLSLCILGAIHPVKLYTVRSGVWRSTFICDGGGQCPFSPLLSHSLTSPLMAPPKQKYCISVEKLPKITLLRTFSVSTVPFDCLILFLFPCSCPCHSLANVLSFQVSSATPLPHENPSSPSVFPALKPPTPLPTTLSFAIIIPLSLF